MKLNIGCGKNRLSGYINLDISPNVGADVVRDIERGLPFNDDMFDEVFSSHTLEHVRDLIFVMNEIWRVCRADALVRIIVPHYKSSGAFRDPTHVRFFTEDSFQYFCGFVDEFSDYGIKCRFKLVEQNVSTDELHIVLRAIKATTPQIELFQRVEAEDRERRIAQLSRNLAEIQSSPAWSAVQTYGRLVDHYFPKHTRKRKLIESMSIKALHLLLTLSHFAGL